MQHEAPLCCHISREIPPFLLSLKRVIDTIEATQEVPRHTRLHSRGTPKGPPQLKKSPGFPSSSREDGLFPCFVEKGIPAFPSYLKRSRSHLDTREELQGSCHYFKKPRCPSALQIHQIPLQLTQGSPQVQFHLVTQSCPTLCDPMKCSTPGLPVHHHLPEFTQTHIHRVCDATRPSHPR